MPPASDYILSQLEADHEHGHTSMRIGTTKEIDPAQSLPKHQLHAEWAQDYYFTTLLYENLEYHVLITRNSQVLDCDENRALEAFGCSTSTSDFEAANNCLDLSLYFVAIDYQARVDERPNDLPPSPIKLRIVTCDSVLQTASHSYTSQSLCPDVVANPVPSLPILSASEVSRITRLDQGIYKMFIPKWNVTACLKTISNATSEGPFMREATSLVVAGRHPNIVGILGCLGGEAGVEGMVLEYIAGPPLSTIRQISSLQASKWIRQISDAVHFLHQEGVIWGDAKPGNILINEKGEAILIDFGGGRTRGWVDECYAETEAGDLQGTLRIKNFILQGVRQSEEESNLQNSVCYKNWYKRLVLISFALVLLGFFLYLGWIM